MNRLPTKDLLNKRGVPFPLNSLNCAFCDMNLESRNHSFFFSRNVMKIIWNEVSLCIGKAINLEEECSANFREWYLFCKSKNVKEGKCEIIWLAISWSIWLVRRNDG